MGRPQVVVIYKLPLPQFYDYNYFCLVAKLERLYES